MTDTDSLADAKRTIETSLLSALAVTSHLHNLRYGDAASVALIAAIMTELQSPAIGWALKAVAREPLR